MKRNGISRRVAALGMALLMAAGMLPAGFVQPAEAANTNNLDAGTAAAYARALQEQIDQYGIRSGEDTVGIAYAGLEDMDANGIPELVIITMTEEWSVEDVRATLWTIKNGQAVRVIDGSLKGGDSLIDDGFIGVPEGFRTNEFKAAYARKNGQVRLFFDWDNWYGMAREWDPEKEESVLIVFYNREFIFINANGEVEENWFSTGKDPDDYENASYDQSWNVDSKALLEYRPQDYTWVYNAQQAKDVRNLLDELKAKSVTPPPPAGSFGPYSISGEFDDIISFDMAKVGTEAVQIRNEIMLVDPRDDETGEGKFTFGPYEEKQYTIISLRPDTKISIVGSGDIQTGPGTTAAEYGALDGGHKITITCTVDTPPYMSQGIAEEVLSEDFCYIVNSSYLIMLDQGGFGPSYRQPQIDETSEPSLVRELTKLISDKLGGEVSGIYELADGVYYILVAIGDTVKGALVKGTKQSGKVVWTVTDTHDEPLESDALDVLAAQFQSASNLTLDFSKLQNSPTIQAVKDYLQDLLDNMDGVTPNDAAKGDLVSFLESAVASVSAASVSGKDNRVTVPAKLASDLAKKAREAKSELEDILFDNDVSLNKPITVLLRVLWQDMDSGEPCQVTLDEELADALGDSTLQLLLGNGKHYIQLSGGRLKDLTDELGALSIQLSQSGEGTYSVSFLDGEGELVEKLPAAITLALPANGPLSTIMASYTGGSDNWGGQYDPSNGAIAFDTVYSGQYQVLENDLDIADVADLPEETRMAISFLVSRGYLNLENGLFRPDAPLTRYEFTEALVGMFFALDRSLTTRFQDVPQDSPYYAHVASAEARKIVEGLSADTFGGDQNITTEQLLALAARTLIDQKGYAEPVDPSEYLDTYADGDQVSDWARAQVALAIREGLVDRGAVLDPQGEISRAQAAVVLYRLFLLLYEVPPVALELPPVTETEGPGGISPAVAAAAAGVSVVAVGGGTAAWLLSRKKKAVK